MLQWIRTKFGDYDPNTSRLTRVKFSAGWHLSVQNVEVFYGTQCGHVSCS